MMNGNRARSTDRLVSIATTGENSSNSHPIIDQEWRDWAGLPDGIVSVIGERLLSEEVTYYVQFRAICSPWRKYTRSPSFAENIFRPYNWIMVKSDQFDRPQRQMGKNQRCFLNTITGKYLRVDIPELNSGFILISMVNGLLLLLNKKTGEMCLLNPFTRSVAQLPPVNKLLSLVPIRKRDLRQYVSTSIFLPSSEVVLFFYYFRKIVHAKPGEQEWVATKTDVSCWSSLYFKGHLYTVTRPGELLRLDLNSENELTILLLEYGRFSTHYLVESGGDMFLVRYCHYVTGPTHFEVYKVDVDKGWLIETTLPDDCAVFLSRARCLSVSTSIFPSLQHGGIYPEKEHTDGIRIHIVDQSLRYKFHGRELSYNDTGSRWHAQYPTEEHFIVDNIRSYCEINLLK